MSTHQEQSPPIPNTRRPIQELVLDDLRARMEVGKERYGTYLQAFNGRDALRDLYEELLDACVYIRQVIEERDEPKPATCAEDCVLPPGHLGPHRDGDGFGWSEPAPPLSPSSRERPTGGV